MRVHDSNWTNFFQESRQVNKMKAGLELTDVPEGFLIPVVATLGVVGNLGKEQFL